jgi:hypothetical protein
MLQSNSITGIPGFNRRWLRQAVTASSQTVRPSNQHGDAARGSRTAAARRNGSRYRRAVRQSAILFDLVRMSVTFAFHS